MTREEAIYRLKNMAWLYGSAEREQNIEAIDMAIEALQAVHTQKGESHEVSDKKKVRHGNETVKREMQHSKPCLVEVYKGMFNLYLRNVSDRRRGLASQQPNKQTEAEGINNERKGLFT